MADLNTEIKLTANATGVETGVARAKRSLADLSASASQAGEQGGKGMGKLGAGAEDSARKVDAATRNMQASLQRQIAALEAGGTATRQYQESLAKLRGVDTNAIKPLLDQLDAAKRKADGAGQGMLGLGSASGILQGQLAALAGSLTLGSMAAFVLQINNGIDALNDIKDATGSTIENISALEDIGKRTGASLDLVGGVLIKFNDVLSKAGPKSDIALQLQAIGLSAEELKRIDPAEALLRTAQALDKYADDGTKARLVQDLFGKSVKEAAPFLKDLAEKGELVAKVTTQQADEAERFNKELFAMQANIQEASRKLAGPLVSAVNEVAKAFRDGSAAGKGFFEIASDRYWANVKGFYNGQGIMSGSRPVPNPRQASGTIGVEGAGTTDAESKPTIKLGLTAAEIAAAKAAAEAAARVAAAARKHELDEQKKFYSDMAGLSADYYDKLARAQIELAAGNITDAQYADYVEQLIKKQPFAIALTKEQTEANKALGKSMEEAAKAAAAYGKQLDDIALAGMDLIAQANARTDAVTEQIAATEFELGLMGKSNTERAIALKQYQIEVDLKKEIARINATIAEQDDKTYAIDAAKKAADRAKANAAAEVVNSEFQRVSQQIEQDLTDALMRGFESGKGFAENLRDTVANMFKTMVLRPVVQAIVSPVAGALTGSLGLAGAANAASGAAGAASGIGLLGSLGTGLGAGASMIAGGGVGGWLSASTSLIGTGTAAGAMAGIGALAGPIGAVLAIGSLIKSLDDSGTYHTGGLGSFSAAGGGAVGDAVKGQGLGFDLASKDYTASSQQAAAQMAQAVAGILDSTASTFGQKAGYFAATAFADDSSRDGAWGALMIKLGDQMVIDWKNGQDKWPGREFADGQAGAKEYAAAVALDVRDYLITQTPDWADTMLKALGDAPTLETLGAVVQQINAAAAALESMGKASAAFAALTDEATNALIAGLGGAEKAVASLSGYYGNFYSEAERAALATQQLTGQLAELGVTMPASREAFRTLVEDTLASGNTELAAQLLTLSSAFANVVPAAQDAATAIDNTAADLARAAERIAKERSGLERQLLQVTGNTTGLRALDLAELDVSNRGIQEQIWAYQDQQAAQEAAAAAAQEAAQAAQEAANAYASAFNDAQQFLDGLRNTITGWLAQQNAQAPGAQGYNSAAASFSSQLTLARGGDRDALGGITSYANTLMDAINRESATASEAALRAGRVRGQLAALPAQVRPEQLIANAIAQWGGNTVNAVSSGAASQVTEIKALAAGYATALVPVVSSLSQGFAALDTNLSNSLDFSEFAAALQGKATDAEIRRLFDMIDQDNDRLISASEATLAAAGTFGDQVAASLPRDFGKIDVNLSGGIDYTEFSNAFAGLATESTLQATFQSIDSNGDGVISQLEASVAATNALGTMITNSLATNFARFDTSGNGGIDFGEFTGSLGGLASEATLRELFNKTDANGDGQISKLEAINANTTATAVDTSNNVVPTLRDINTGLGYHFGNLWYGLHTDLSAISGQLATGIKVTSLNQSAGSPVAFAQGGVFSNSIVNTPTRFNMGLMGEAGPEAIMPLARTSSGDLGVQVQMPDWSQYGRGDSNNNAALVAEIRALREDNQAQARALVQMQNRMTKVLESWDGNGIPEERVTA